MRALFIAVALSIALAACTSKQPPALDESSPTAASPTPTAEATATLIPAPEPTGTPAPAPGPGTFGQTGQLRDGRHGHSATPLPDGRVLIVGGLLHDVPEVAEDALLYDPLTGVFAPAGDTAVPRWFHSAIRLDDGRVLITGGTLTGNEGLRSAEIYDPATGTFTLVGEMQFERWGRSAALLADGRVLVAGGGPEESRATAELFDPETQTFARTGNMNIERAGHELTTLLDGRVLVSGDGPLEIYYPASGEFRLLDLEPPGIRPSATLLLDGRVLLAGGSDREQLQPARSNGHAIGPATTQAVIFDPIREQLIESGPMLGPRQDHAAALLTDGRVLLSGGAQDVHHDAPLLASAEIFEPAAGEFTATGAMYDERFGHTLTLLEDDSVLVFGTVSSSALVHAERYFPPPRQTRAISGLYTEPRKTEPDVRRTLGPRPPSPFAPWNREDVVLYDVQTMTETNLGPGGHASFSPDGTRLAWAAGKPGRLTELWVLDLATGEQQLIGPGRSLVWVDDETLVFHPAGVSNTEELVDVATGVRRPANGATLNPVYRPVEASGWRLDRLEQGEYPIWRSTYELTHSSGARLPLRFDAFRAVLTPDGTLFVATVPGDPSGMPANDGPHIEFGSTNIFAVDPATAEATFIATATASAPNWAFDASANHVAWMQGFCGSQDPDVPSTRVFDRRNGTLTEIDDGMWLVLTPDGTIGDGQFGPQALIDIETLEYTMVLPVGFTDIVWSPDYRYAAVSFAGGHGGLCG